MSEWATLEQRYTNSYRLFLKATTCVTDDLRYRSGFFGHWSPRDVILHHAAWDREAARRFREILNGDNEDRNYDVDVFSARSVEAGKDLSWEEAIGELHAAYKGFRDIIAGIMPEQAAADHRLMEWLARRSEDYEHHTANFNELRPD